ncbi:MAG: hypothetical protein H6673_13585 [Anaerolineales bacterium]|nr:hypothetical protein [Anaerolineales bacterium]
MMGEQKQLIERLVALANTNGGALTLPAAQRPMLEQVVAQCQPPLVIQIQDGADCVEVKVPQSSMVHATLDGRVLGESRQGPVELNGTHIRQLAALRVLGDFETTPVPGVLSADLDFYPPPESVTVAEVVMYAHQPHQWLPQAHVVVRRWVGAKVVTQQAYYGSLPRLLEQAEAAIADHQCPPLVIRESIINALIHRDYRLPQPIMIDVHPQTIDIASPGGPPAFVSITQITKHRYRRNPRIAQWMVAAGYDGLGLATVYRLAAEAGYPEPSLTVQRNHLHLRVYRNKTRATPSIPDLNERQERALAYLREHGSITQRVYSALCPDTAAPVLQQELSALEQLGMLTRIGELAYMLEPSWT